MVASDSFVVRLAGGPTSSGGEEFKVGGKSGSVVVMSSNPKVRKGWRVVAINGKAVNSPQNAKEDLEEFINVGPYASIIFSSVYTLMREAAQRQEDHGA